jgi:hypothetical protein
LEIIKEVHDLVFELEIGGRSSIHGYKRRKKQKKTQKSR